jgi:hypothetical protein
VRKKSLKNVTYYVQMPTSKFVCSMRGDEISALVTLLFVLFFLGESNRRGTTKEHLEVEYCKSEVPES